MSMQQINTSIRHTNRLSKKIIGSAVFMTLLSVAGLTHAQRLVPTEYLDARLAADQSLTAQAGGASLASAANSANVSSATIRTISSAAARNTENQFFSASEIANDPIFNAPDVSAARAAGVPVPSIRISDVSYIKTTLIPTTRYGSQKQIDVSLLDDFITKTASHARHYPPNFKNASERYYTKEKLKVLEEWIRPYAESTDASYEVLIRAAKLNGMGRNLDLGSDYAVRASDFVAKAITREPNNAEANFLYGMMLSEGGGFKEGKKYLTKAVSLGYTEAEQSLAQSDLLNNRRSEALSRLQRLQSENPSDSDIARQIQIVENGDYYIWDLPTQ